MLVTWLSLKRETGNRGMRMGMGERGTGNGESLKRGIFKRNFVRDRARGIYHAIKRVFYGFIGSRTHAGC